MDTLRTLSSWEQCKHKNLRFFEQTNKVICMDCGFVWVDNQYNPTIPTPNLPYEYPNPMPNYPIYPIITWNKVD